VEILTIPIEETKGRGKYILYRPMLGIAFVGNRAMVDLVTALNQGIAPEQGEILQFLHQNGFLNPDPPEPAATKEPFKPTTAVLLMTNQCQLRCIYCYAEAGKRHKEELSFELGKTAIDYVVRNAQELGKKQFGLSFHGGGEPVKAWKVLQACTEYARSQSIQADITLTSNGMWSASQSDWIIENISGISLSMDGGRETQNRQRPTRGGKGSFGAVMHAATALDRRQFSYGIRMTATAPWSHLPEDVRFLCESTHCKTIQVEPAFWLGQGGHVQPSEAEGQAFLEAVLEAYDVAESYQRHFYYAGGRLGSISDTFCTSPYSGMIVRPDGELVSCYEVTNRDHPLAEISRIGRIDKGQVLWDMEARAHLHTLMFKRREHCRDCFCYWTCAGNCYTRAFGPAPDGHLYYGVLCDVTRRLVKELILRNIAKSNGVWHRSSAQEQVDKRKTEKTKG
jgi:uncharacterized protein